MDCSPPGSAIRGICQARILEWVAISFFRDFPPTGIEPMSPELAGGFFTIEPPGKPRCVYLHLHFHVTDHITLGEGDSSWKKLSEPLSASHVEVGKVGNRD